MDFHEALREFLADLKLAGRVGRTVRGHELELLRLGRWLEAEAVAWQAVNTRQLQQYARLRAERGHSSRANMFCSLRSFYRWSVEQGYIAISPAAGFKTPKRPKPLPRALTLGQVRQILEALRAAEGRRTRRDEALLLTALYAGLRAKELACLEWHHVDLKEAIISIVISKMQAGRVVPMHADLVATLTSWQALQGQHACGPVFSLDGQAFNGNRVGKICRYWRAKTGVSFTAHMLRHTFATWALRRSHDLYGVSKALGHGELRQTEIYVSTDPEYSRHAVAALPALEDW